MQIICKKWRLLIWYLHNGFRHNWSSFSIIWNNFFLVIEHLNYLMASKNLYNDAMQLNLWNSLDCYQSKNSCDLEINGHTHWINVNHLSLFVRLPLRRMLFAILIYFPVLEISLYHESANGNSTDLTFCQDNIIGTHQVKIFNILINLWTILMYYIV